MSADGTHEDRDVDRAMPAPREPAARVRVAHDAEIRKLNAALAGHKSAG